MVVTPEVFAVDTEEEEDRAWQSEVLEEVEMAKVREETGTDTIPVLAGMPTVALAADRASEDIMDVAM